MPAPDSEFIQGTGWRRALLRGYHSGGTAGDGESLLKCFGTASSAGYLKLQVAHILRRVQAWEILNVFENAS